MDYLFENINPFNTLIKKGEIEEIIVACEYGLSHFIIKSNIIADNWDFFSSLSFSTENKYNKKHVYDNLLNYINNFCKKEYRNHPYFLSLSKKEGKDFNSLIEEMYISNKMLLYFYKKGLNPWFNNSDLIKKISSPKKIKDEWVFPNNEIVEFFIEDKEFDNLEKDSNCHYLLHYAAENNNFFLADYLLNNGYSVEHFDSSGETALFKSRSPEMIKKLFNSGVSVFNQKDKNITVESIIDRTSVLSHKNKMTEAIYSLSHFSSNESLGEIYLEQAVSAIYDSNSKKKDFVNIYNKVPKEYRKSIISYKEKNSKYSKELNCNLMGHCLYVLRNYFNKNYCNRGSNVDLLSKYRILTFLEEQGFNLDSDISIKTKEEEYFKIKSFDLFISLFYKKHETIKTFHKLLNKMVFEQKNGLKDNMCLDHNSFENSLKYIFSFKKNVSYPEYQDICENLENALVLREFYINNSNIDTSFMDFEIFKMYMNRLSSRKEILNQKNKNIRSKISFTSSLEIEKISALSKKYLSFEKDDMFLDDKIFKNLLNNGTDKSKNMLSEECINLLDYFNNNALKYLEEKNFSDLDVIYSDFFKYINMKINLLVDSKLFDLDFLENIYNKVDNIDSYSSHKAKEILEPTKTKLEKNLMFSKSQNNFSKKKIPSL